MITCILQYEISLGMKFSNLGHDLLLRVMNLLTSHYPISTLNLNMSSQHHVISYLHVMSYLFDFQNVSTSL